MKQTLKSTISIVVLHGIQRFGPAIFGKGEEWTICVDVFNPNIRNSKFNFEVVNGHLTFLREARRSWLWDPESNRVSATETEPHADQAKRTKKTQTSCTYLLLNNKCIG